MKFTSLIALNVTFCSSALLSGCSTIDDLTTGNWTNWGCEGDAQKTFNYSLSQAEAYCKDSRMQTQKSWAKANNLPESHSWSNDAANKLLLVAAGNQKNVIVTGTTSDLDTSISCKGMANCKFQMPSAPCGKYSQYTYPGGYSFEQINTCPYNVIYKLVIYQGPGFSPYGAYSASPRLRSNEKFRGNSMFKKANSIKVIDDYSCRTIDDVGRMVGLKLSSGGPAVNQSGPRGCFYITSSDPVPTSK
jgi:hypothetical protein